ncbi:hypothetical protein K493DRAFT_313153 [Basidiobolus meristosporus CBS 931.73]|uniref:Uncharacterized protein n=1 Tax=Basidiobolus meristosporus CBS 931.73 TaxID=1314790 RepID=A0A1Y1YPA6_9FUNG|nr:hypothetical protein K493DRAFT_313153 [Basidiobolus meristosporus CBS 931.73]|eukprot:ORX99663.1 hypothetical protein K493DRAFT_313153 [Basidiobolus meristosporus CBS 931.73]
MPDQVRFLQGGILTLGVVLLFYFYSDFLEPTPLLILLAGVMLFIWKDSIAVPDEEKLVAEGETEELKCTSHYCYTRDYAHDRDDVSEASSATLSSSTDSFFDSSDSDSEEDDSPSERRVPLEEFNRESLLEKQPPHIVVNIS